MHHYWRSFIINMDKINLNRFFGTAEELDKFLIEIEVITPEQRRKLIHFAENGIQVSAYGLQMHGISRQVWPRLLPEYILQEVLELEAAESSARAAQDALAPGEIPLENGNVLPVEGEGEPPSLLRERGWFPLSLS